MIDYEEVFKAIKADERIQRNLQWGEPRFGHPEGSVDAHVADVDRNIEALRPKLIGDEYWKLRVLARTHDAFKAEAAEGAWIRDPDSHASLARKFLAGFCRDDDLLQIVQFHDEPYSLWRQQQKRGHFDHERFEALIHLIRDWNVFLAFCIADGSTEGKSREPLHWLFNQAAGRVVTRFTKDDIL